LASAQDKIVIRKDFDGLSEQADRPTLLAIARVLFRSSPPSWLRFVVRDEHVAREYIPTEDLESLSWMEPELDQVLLDVHNVDAAHDDGLLKAMGTVAELFVMAALERAGARPLHVSKLSDTYGYDIESAGKTIERIEVKAASQSTQTKFHISRNEFEKSSRYGHEWKLVQVIFSSKAFVSDRLDSSHIDSVRDLRHGVLQELVPADTKDFKWTKSAQISTTPEAWIPTNVILDPEFSTDGFRSAIVSASVK
jgi:hypothetical protein